QDFPAKFVCNVERMELPFRQELAGRLKHRTIPGPVVEQGSLVGQVRSALLQRLIGTGCGWRPGRKHQLLAPAGKAVTGVAVVDLSDYAPIFFAVKFLQMAAVVTTPDDDPVGDER